MIFLVCFALALGVPLGVAAFLTWRSRRPELTSNSGRVVLMVLVSGALGITPIAFILALGEGWDALFLGWTLGAAYGALVGAAALFVRRVARRYLERSG